jgi:hypothetical protein
MMQIVKPVPTCGKCGARAPRFLQRCANCGHRRWWPFGAGAPGARY